MNLIAADVALAFNGATERKTWAARHYTKDGNETVLFTGGRQNLITLALDCDTRRFHVRFNRTHAAWGDYVTAIAKALYVVLTTLKAAGLPFEAPPDANGIEIVVTRCDEAVYVRWPGQNPVTPATAIMAEIRTPELVENVTQALAADG